MVAFTAAGLDSLPAAAKRWLDDLGFPYTGTPVVPTFGAAVDESLRFPKAGSRAKVDGLRFREGSRARKKEACRKEKGYTLKPRANAMHIGTLHPGGEIGSSIHGGGCGRVTLPATASRGGDP